MWTVQREYLEPVGTLRLRFLAGGDCLSYEGFLRALAKDASFRDVILKEMRAAPFTAFRWETPPLTANNIVQHFECLLHDSPDLDVRADPTDFEPFFATHRFLNLSIPMEQIEKLIARPQVNLAGTARCEIPPRDLYSPRRPRRLS
jgi:hypothetical protein